jgi:hypothetical protein
VTIRYVAMGSSFAAGPGMRAVADLLAERLTPSAAL